MNSIQKKQSAVVWSKLEALSKLRKFLLNELDFLDSLSGNFASNKIELAVNDIDQFSSELSAFNAALKYLQDEELIERTFDELSVRHERLMLKIEEMGLG